MCQSSVSRKFVAKISVRKWAKPFFFLCALLHLPTPNWLFSVKIVGEE